MNPKGTKERTKKRREKKNRGQLESCTLFRFCQQSKATLNRKRIKYMVNKNELRLSILIDISDIRI